MNITYDGKFIIATGRSRKETSWKNKELTWSDFLEKIQNTHRTPETYSDYIKAKKERQDEIKDIGGFVGGRLTGGRRKSGNVFERQLITLDIDYCKTDFWEDFTMLYGNAGALYSTHKHNPEMPRLRLIIPLDRPVFADEYIAIARKIAGNLNIEVFDPTTFQPERLMYWPSTSSNGEFIFKYQDGEFISADAVLASYIDWKDSTEWPVSEKVDKLLLRAIAKQGDPFEKPGVIGVFCRSYTIDEAIEVFLNDVYTACDMDNRYSYVEGSTSGGLITYDDKFAYSHHGTDPSSGKLCNAFDLVRIHKFGIKDEDASEDTPVNKKPSHLAMLDFVRTDKRVKKLIITEKIENAVSDFEKVEPVITGCENEDLGCKKGVKRVSADCNSSVIAVDENTDWQEKLEVDRKGNVNNTIDNILLILENDPYFKGKIAYDDFEKCEVALKDLPWRKIKYQNRRLNDKDDANIRHYIEKAYGVSNGLKIRDAMEVLATKTAFHPIKQYLNKLVWDKQDRLDMLLIDYLGAENTDYVREVTRKTFVAAVARIFQPAVKFDYVLTLVGKQGIGKSTLIRKLGKNWYSDSFSTVQGKEAFEQIQGVWLVEIGELAGLKKAEIDTIKHFVSKQVDNYRVAYGKRTESFARQCIFFGTTNHKDFLRDPTGDRRFWPVDTHVNEPIKDIFKHLTSTEIDQIWAEAVMWYESGEILKLSNEIEKQATDSQTEHREKDDREGLIQRYLDMLLPADWENKSIYDRRAYLQDEELREEGVIERTRVCIGEIWCELFGGQQKDMNRYNTKDIHNIMRNMKGWRELASKKLKHKIYGVQKGYEAVAKAKNGCQEINFDVATVAKRLPLN